VNHLTFQEYIKRIFNSIDIARVAFWNAQVAFSNRECYSNQKIPNNQEGDRGMSKPASAKIAAIFAFLFILAACGNHFHGKKHM